MAKKYNADQLTVLQGLEAVRKRPGMYIGGVNSAGLHHSYKYELSAAYAAVLRGLFFIVRSIHFEVSTARQVNAKCIFPCYSYTQVKEDRPSTWRMSAGDPTHRNVLKLSSRSMYTVFC